MERATLQTKQMLDDTQHNLRDMQKSIQQKDDELRCPTLVGYLAGGLVGGSLPNLT